MNKLRNGFALISGWALILMGVYAFGYLLGRLMHRVFGYDK